MVRPRRMVPASFGSSDELSIDLVAVLFGFAFLAAAHAVEAADLPPEPATEAIDAQTFNDRWKAALGVYVWAASLSGSVGAGGLSPADVDASFGDILLAAHAARIRTEALGDRRCGQTGLSDELRARVTSWPPLRSARRRKQITQIQVEIDGDKTATQTPDSQKYPIKSARKVAI